MLLVFLILVVVDCVGVGVYKGGKKESLMIEVSYFVFVVWVDDVKIDVVVYDWMYVEVVIDFDVFWVKEVRCFDWIVLLIRIKDILFDESDFYICWFEDG